MINAEQLIEDDAIDVFDDSNAGYAAASAAADLLNGWASYDDAYRAAHAHEYQPYDVDLVIEQLKTWRDRGCPAPYVKGRD